MIDSLMYFDMMAVVLIVGEVDKERQWTSFLISVSSKPPDSVETVRMC